MPSTTYAFFRRAILERKLIVCRYQGKRREIAPHILGFKNRIEKALVFQFGGETNSTLPPGGEWRCFALKDVVDRPCWTANGTPARRTARRRPASISSMSTSIFRRRCGEAWSLLRSFPRKRKCQSVFALGPRLRRDERKECTSPKIKHLRRQSLRRVNAAALPRNG